MARTILLFSTTILTIFFTIHTFWRHLFGFSTLDSINRFPLLFSPASYVYLYWLAVFIGLIIYALDKRQHTSKQVTLLLLAYIFLISFFVSWHAAHYIIALLLLTVQLLSLFLLYRTYPIQRERVAISLFFGWMLLLAHVFFSYTMVYHNWHGLGLSNALRAVILLTVGAMAALYFRYRYFDKLLPSIFIWGYLGIAWHNGFEELFVTAAALFLSAVLAASLLFSKGTNN